MFRQRCKPCRAEIAARTGASFVKANGFGTRSNASISWHTLTARPACACGNKPARQRLCHLSGAERHECLGLDWAILPRWTVRIFDHAAIQ